MDLQLGIGLDARGVAEPGRCPGGGQVDRRCRPVELAQVGLNATGGGQADQAVVLLIGADTAADHLQVGAGGRPFVRRQRDGDVSRGGRCATQVARSRCRRRRSSPPGSRCRESSDAFTSKARRHRETGGVTATRSLPISSTGSWAPARRAIVARCRSTWRSWLGCWRVIRCAGAGGWTRRPDRCGRERRSSTPGNRRGDDDTVMNADNPDLTWSSRG